MANSLLKSLSFHRSEPLSRMDDCALRIEELKEKIKRSFVHVSPFPTAVMRLIDDTQRLGLAYHFEDDIKKMLNGFSGYDGGNDLFSTALRFRLLRQNGFHGSCEVFDKFIDENGTFKGCLFPDTEDILSFYEASFMAAASETKLSRASKIAATQLKQSLASLPPKFKQNVSEALKLPRHFRMVRLEARNFITSFGVSKETACSSSLQQLAKLDFNMVQLQHQNELAEIIRWWKELGLVDKLKFARDRPRECFLWTVGIFPEPNHSDCRIELCKTIAILLVIDDVYDKYGSLDELILFTDAIKRWDLDAMNQLPEYMKLCYMALYNTTNDIAYKILKKSGVDTVPYLKKTWIDILEAFFIEAKWFHMGYVPKLEEYLSNGIISGGTCMALVHSFFLLGHGVTKLESSIFKPYPNSFYCAGKILRLWDDLGTSKEEQERGDVASSIQCYMDKSGNEGISEDRARKNMKKLIRNLWVELNGELLSSTGLPLSVINAFNLSRTSQVIYQHGDDNTFPAVSDVVHDLFFNPIV